MRILVTLRDGRTSGTVTEAVIEAAPDCPLADLLPHLHRIVDEQLAAPGDVPIWVDGVPAERTAPLRVTGIRSGSVVDLFERVEQPAIAVSGAAELRLVNGPGAGRVHRLGVGRTVVGHGAAGLALPDRRAAPDALELSVRPGGDVSFRTAPDAGASIDGRPMHRGVWTHGDYLTVADSVLQLTAPSDTDVPDPPSRPGPGRSPRSRAVAERRSADPDPAATLLTAVGRGPRLWERHPQHGGWLRLRVGLSPQPVPGDHGTADTGGRPSWRRKRRTPPPPVGHPSVLAELPATLDLPVDAPLAVVGPRAVTDPTAAWLVAQCAAYHSPPTLRMAILTTADYAARRRWEWAARLPHLRPDEASGVSVLIGNDQDSIGMRTDELSELIADRTEDRRRGGEPGGAVDGCARRPDVVLIVDRGVRLDHVAGAGALRDATAAGVYPICLAGDEQDLALPCRTVLRCTSGPLDVRLDVHRPTGWTGASGRPDGPAGIRPDLVEPAWAEHLSRALAGLGSLDPEPTPGSEPAEPAAWGIGWDDIGYPAPARRPVR